MIYDPDANILSWTIARGRIAYAREFGALIVHFSRNGRPLLIEMLDASKFVGQVDKLKVGQLKALKQMMAGSP